MKCSKKKDKCEHECVCQNPTEIPDENSICRGLVFISTTILIDLFLAACRMNPCHHNGSCRVEGKKQICDCVPGYDGDFCENGFSINFLVKSKISEEYLLGKSAIKVSNGCI